MGSGCTYRCSFHRGPAAHLLLGGPVLNGPRTGTGLWSGVGDPCSRAESKDSGGNGSAGSPSARCPSGPPHGPLTLRLSPLPRSSQNPKEVWQRKMLCFVLVTLSLSRSGQGPGSPWPGPRLARPGADPCLPVACRWLPIALASSVLSLAPSHPWQR